MHDGNLIIAECKPLRVTAKMGRLYVTSVSMLLKGSDRFAKLFVKAPYPPPPTPVPLHPPPPLPASKITKSHNGALLSVSFYEVREGRATGMSRIISLILLFNAQSILKA